LSLRALASWLYLIDFDVHMQVSDDLFTRLESWKFYTAKELIMNFLALNACPVQETDSLKFMLPSGINL